MNPDQPIPQQARDWALRTGDPEFADWEGFTAWLEADPANAAAYDAVQFALGQADAALALLPEPAPVVPAANDNPAGVGWKTAWRGWLGGAIAAALVLALTTMLWPGVPDGTQYQTAPGETRLIALADGSTVELAGGSRIALTGERGARLDAGQALFTIRHDDAHPFILMVGKEQLVDAGTVFDVRLAGETLDLAVSEGAVIVNPDRQALRIDAGMRAVREGGRYRVAPIDPGAVGEWSRGRISFENANLAEIAAELSRATGIRFTSGDSVTRLSGSIALDTVRSDPRVLEALLGVRVRTEGESWVLSAE
jgi:transmembrane sensor